MYKYDIGADKTVPGVHFGISSGIDKYNVGMLTGIDVYVGKLVYTQSTRWSSKDEQTN